MKYDKSYLRNRFLLQRKKKYLTTKKFNFNLIFKLIRKHFSKNKIIIAGYYPSYYEVDISNFLEKASKKKFRIALPVIKSSNILVQCRHIFIMKKIFNNPQHSFSIFSSFFFTVSKL